MLGLQKIRNLAARKGYSVAAKKAARDGVERVIISDAKGREVASPDAAGFNVGQAQRFLESRADTDSGAAPSFGKRSLLPSGKNGA